MGQLPKSMLLLGVSLGWEVRHVGPVENGGERDSSCVGEGVGHRGKSEAGQGP